MSSSSPHSSSSQTIAVIGAGVIGLTSALLIQQHIKRHSLPYTITILAKEFPNPLPPTSAHIQLPGGVAAAPSADYASMWAGAHVRPIPGDTEQLKREARWLRESASVFGTLTNGSGIDEKSRGDGSGEKETWGVTALKGVEYLAKPDAAYKALVSSSPRDNEASFLQEHGLSGFRKLEDLPEGIEVGFEYDTYCVNSPIYCAALLRKFLLGGGRTVSVGLGSEWDVWNLLEKEGGKVKLVVNASGMGFGDEKSYFIRGQTALTTVPFTRTITRQNSDGTWTFIIPRFFSGGTIIGGTKEIRNLSILPLASTRQSLLEKAVEMQPSIRGEGGELPTVLADIVGRRPAREGGVRLEVEEREGNKVVHAYGAGGRGYEISWGVGSEVLELIKGVLGTNVKARL